MQDSRPVFANMATAAHSWAQSISPQRLAGPLNDASLWLRAQVPLDTARGHSGPAGHAERQHNAHYASSIGHYALRTLWRVVFAVSRKAVRVALRCLWAAFEVRAPTVKALEQATPKSQTFHLFSFHFVVALSLRAVCCVNTSESLCRWSAD